MTITSLGDLALSFQLRKDNARLSEALARVTREVASGRVADVNDRVAGDYGPLNAMESGLRRLDAYDTSIADWRLEVTARQSSISQIRTLAEEVIGPLLQVQDTGDQTLVESAARDTASRFESVLSTLNSQIGGRALFSGTALDQPAVADADTLLSSLESEIALAGAVTAADIEAVVTTWFGSGGGFETTGYIGSPDSLSAPRISDDEVLGQPPRADDDRMREALRGFAMAALIDRGALSGDPSERNELLRRSGEVLLEADRSLVDLQAEIGTSEARIERASIENAAERDMLELARSELVGVDPYEAATELQSIETQLQSLYTVTARLSRLSLTEFLR